MRNIRQRKIDENKPLPIVIFYSLLNQGSSSTEGNSTTSSIVAEVAPSQSISNQNGGIHHSNSTRNLSEMMLDNSLMLVGTHPDTIPHNTKGGNAHHSSSNGFIINHHASPTSSKKKKSKLQKRKSMTPQEELKLIAKETGLDEDTLQVLLKCQENNDNISHNYTYDHTIDEEADHGRGGLGNARRSGSGAIFRSSSSSSQNSLITAPDIVIHIPNVKTISDQENNDKFLDSSSTSSSTTTTSAYMNGQQHASKIRAEFSQAINEKKRRRKEQSQSRKKSKFQQTTHYLHYLPNHLQVENDTKSILYDMEDDDFTFLEKFHENYLRTYEECFGEEQCFNGIRNKKTITMEQLLQRWHVSSKHLLPTPAQAFQILDEDFFEECIDRFEKTTAFSNELCTFRSALEKFPSLKRYFLDVENYLTQSHVQNSFMGLKSNHQPPSPSVNSSTMHKQQPEPSTNGNLSSTFTERYASTPQFSKLYSSSPFLHFLKNDSDSRYNLNIFANSKASPENNSTTPQHSTLNNSIHSPSLLQQDCVTLSTTRQPNLPSSLATLPSMTLHNNAMIPPSQSSPSASSMNTSANHSIPPVTNDNSTSSSPSSVKKILPTSFLYEIYLFWRKKRLSRTVSSTDKMLYPTCGRPLILDFEKQTSIHDKNHHAAFRPRQLPKKQTEEILNDTSSLQRLRKLRKDLISLNTLMEMINTREEKKLEYVTLLQEILLNKLGPSTANGCPIEPITSSEQNLSIVTSRSIQNDNMKPMDSLASSNHASKNMADEKLSATAASSNNMPIHIEESKKVLHQQESTCHHNNQEMENTIEYNPMSESVWKQQHKQDDQTGYTSMNLLHFKEILKKHNRPFFPFLAKYVRKVRNFTGDDSIEEQFNTDLPSYVPGSEYKVQLTRDGVTFDFPNMQEAFSAQHEIAFNHKIDNLLADEVAQYKHRQEQVENGNCSSGDMLIQILDEAEENATCQKYTDIPEVQLSEFEERINDTIDHTNEFSHLTNDPFQPHVNDFMDFQE
ncbi:hypothetical protein C9374_011561 [Naegleria lovaniensis]|uniref:Uncharacterized protein n=1 Tax=Naegleria lovaniensis TaxID=51637 RepID=A0AA88H2R3_NAELO|nr:uncharacterized protein C9374_011561 [Naegleria lovaniensis]KAG2392836.1 hypothetical protein C9374_011561 [Naegleria lovaniensis]